MTQLIDRNPVMTSASEQYREIVRHYIHEGQISPAARQILDQQRRYLKLLSQETEAIERSVLTSASAPIPAPDSQPVPDVSLAAGHRKTQGKAGIAEPRDEIAFQSPDSEALPNRQSFKDDSQEDSENNSLLSDLWSDSTASIDHPSDPAAISENLPLSEAASQYQAAFAQAIRLQFPPDEVLKLGLRSLQQTLNLNEQAVETIEIRVIEELEAEQQQYKANLEKYREEFTGSRAFLYSESVQDELWELQRKLGLRSEDVLRLEREVMREAKRDTHQDFLSTIDDPSTLVDIQVLEDAIKKELFRTSDPPPDREASHSQSSTSHAQSHIQPEIRVVEPEGSPVTDQPPVTDVHRADAGFDQPQNQVQAGSPPAVTPEADPQPPPSGSQDHFAIAQPELEQALQELEKCLANEGQRDWWEADQITFEILLKLSPNESLGWLNMSAIEQIDQLDALQRIDRLWSVASQGKFGLRAQREVYKTVVEELKEQYQYKMKDDRLQQLYVQEFVRRIGWWDSRLQFLKFYKWLDFQPNSASRLDVPLGQFPAYWFWAIPRKHALQLGGIGFGQGGWRIDMSRLRAWINKLRSCKLEPYENYIAPGD
jgi:hypothetical protein